ncbi:DUF993 family protein [Nocardioides terrisoli]|uniref:DUF993 family protein n=1 Tax=Nocardioides terrisoli TaxID=3388267 RepID=UPI00287BA06D|nr:DUF993 family protein [Nocardioides marmorisolisilvae]
MIRIDLPTADGDAKPYRLSGLSTDLTQAPPPQSRVAYAAVHVIADARRASIPEHTRCIDWEGTLRQRSRIWDLGLGVAEAMDTAQRGMGLPWSDVHRLVRMTLEAAKPRGASTVVGIGTDALPPGPTGIERIVDAYLEELDFVEGLGGTAVMMPSRQLAATATTPEHYVKVYDAVLADARRPVILHWLGEQFDPCLKGYWGINDPAEAVDTVAEIVRSRPDVVDGIKMSVLDPALEEEIRGRLHGEQRVYTGDDFHYVDLIGGTARGHSHALLGAFAAIAPIARLALGHLDDGDLLGYRRTLGPTEQLSRLLFEAPTQYYKTGIAWIAYLQGYQDHFRMLAGLEAGRSVVHLAELFKEADTIGLFTDPSEAARRMQRYLTLHGMA